MQIRDGPHFRPVAPKALLDGTSISFTDGVAIQNIAPNELVIQLANGREVSYDKLIIAEDLEETYSNVPGLLDGLSNPYHPIFTASGEFSKKMKLKELTYGQVIVYIPPYPFNGQDDFTSYLRVIEKLQKKSKKY